MRRRAGQISRARQNFLIGRKRAVHALQRRIFGRKRAAVDGMNLKARRGLDDGLDLVQIADAGQLDKNLVRAQAVLLNQRLTHAQRVHAVANGFDRLFDRPLFEIVLENRLHGQRQVVVVAAGEIVFVGILVAGEQ